MLQNEGETRHDQLNQDFYKTFMNTLPPSADLLSKQKLRLAATANESHQRFSRPETIILTGLTGAAGRQSSIQKRYKEPFDVKSMAGDREFQQRKVITQQIRKISGKLFNVELAFTKLKCYITCKRGQHFSVLALWSKQALKLVS